MKPAKKSSNGVARFRVEREEADRAILGYRLTGNNKAAGEVDEVVDSREHTYLTRDHALLILAGNIALHNAAPELPTNRTNLDAYQGAEEAREFFGDGAVRTIQEGAALLLKTSGSIAGSSAA